MVILLFFTYFLAFAVFLGIFFYFIVIIDSAFGGLDFGTSNLAIKKIASIIEAHNAGKGTLYDLGSCRGSFATTIAKHFFNIRVLGIDNNRFRILCSKIRAITTKNVIFRKENIFNTDVSKADMVYLYLPKELMLNLQAKLQKELKFGAMVISSSVCFPNWEPIETFVIHPEKPEFEKIFVYKKA